jgi:ATP-binding cassette subfamily F protein 3
VELQRLDERLAVLAREKSEVEALLSRPGANADDFADWGRRLAHIQAETGQIEERWLQLHAELDALQTG